MITMERALANCHHRLLSLLQKPTFEVIFDLSPGGSGGEYLNLDDGETELQVRWKTIAKPRMLQDLQSDNDEPDLGLNATALTTAFLEKKLEGGPVSEEQIMIRVE